MRGLPLNNQRGSALLVAIGIAALLAVFTYAGMQMSRAMQNQTQNQQGSLEGTKFADYLSSLLSDPDICHGSGHFTGLKVRNQDTFSQRINMTPGTRQDIELGTSLPSLTSSGHQAVAGVTATEFNGGSQLNSFYIVPDSGGTSAAVSAVIGGTTQPLGTLYLTLSGTGISQTITACQMKMGASQVCQQMGCVWLGPPASPACKCSLPTLDCTPNGPNAYVDGFTVNGGVAAPICKMANFTCGSGQYLRGFGSDGGLICTSVVSVP